MSRSETVRVWTGALAIAVALAGIVVVVWTIPRSNGDLRADRLVSLDGRSQRSRVAFSRL